MAKIKSSEKIQRKQQIQDAANKKRARRDDAKKVIADQQKEIEALKRSNDEYAKEQRAELERKLQEQQAALDSMDIDIENTEKEEEEIDAMEVDDEPGDNSDGQTSQGKQEPANDDGTGSEVPYHYEDDDDVEELSGLDVRAFKEAQGLDDTECQVKAKKTNVNGRDTVFTQYGPKSHAKFRIEPGSSAYYDQEDPDIPDVTAPSYRMGSKKLGKKWKYGKNNFDSIIAVAWKPSNEASPLNDIDPDLAKERKRYTETAVLIQWKGIDSQDLVTGTEVGKSDMRPTVNGKVRTWETRTVARRVFPIMKKGAADRALYLQAEKAEKAYIQWKEGGSSGRDETMTPAPLLPDNESPGGTPAPAKRRKRAVQFEGSTSTSTPAATSTPAIGTEATPTPTPSDTTAPTPSDTAAAGTSTAEAPKESIKEFLRLYEEMSGGPITDMAEKVEIIRLYQKQGK